MKVLICGGTDFADYAGMCAVLNPYPITSIVHGDAEGADTLAQRYADEHNIPTTRFPADWDNITRRGAVIRYRRNGHAYDAAAGPVRNHHMLDTSHPDCVLAFPGHKGTADMVRYARQQGYDVRCITQGALASLRNTSSTGALYGT